MKKVNKPKTFVLRLEFEKYEKLDKLAKEMKISVNTLVNWSLEEFLRKSVTPKEIVDTYNTNGE